MLSSNGKEKRPRLTPHPLTAAVVSKTGDTKMTKRRAKEAGLFNTFDFKLAKPGDHHPDLSTEPITTSTVPMYNPEVQQQTQEAPIAPTTIPGTSFLDFCCPNPHYAHDAYAYGGAIFQDHNHHHHHHQQQQQQQQPDISMVPGVLPVAANGSPSQQALLTSADLDYFEQFLAQMATGEIGFGFDSLGSSGGLSGASSSSSTSSLASLPKSYGRPVAPALTRSSHNRLDPTFRPASLPTSKPLSTRTSRQLPQPQSTTALLQHRALIDAKRAHHLACEHKRRSRIRNELQRIADLVPGLTGCTAKSSQSKILQGAAEFMERIVGENGRLTGELVGMQRVVIELQEQAMRQAELLKQYIPDAEMTDSTDIQTD